MNTTYLSIADGGRLAYQKLDGSGPYRFLCGHGSDMFGSKAEALMAYCEEHGRAFVRFDYTGHGLSSGAFLDGTISAWTNDALAILDEIVSGPVILVGSSLGGWIMLNLAKQRGERVVGALA